MEQKIAEYKAVLKKYAYTLTHNKEDAEDLFQDTILKILTSQHLYTEETYFRSWASRIMKNLFIDKYRKESRLPFVRLKSKDSIQNDDHIAHTNNYDNYLDNNSHRDFNLGESGFTIKDIQEEIDLLREDYRQIITLRLQGYTFKEMEGMLNLSSPRMRTLHFNGIRILREKLKIKLSL